MKVAVVGGGILGLTLGLRLARLGHGVEILEAAPTLGGLACAHDYGAFTWDRFYHCILPTDANLIGLLRELGLEKELRWTRTGTGYYAGGRFHPMSSNADFLRFPLLSLVDKARLGATLLYAVRFADPWRLYRVTAEEWLTRTCGRHGYEVFWRPLLKAKFGPFYDRVAAVFIWATLTRLYGARSAATAKEKLGYVRGGYARILERMEIALGGLGATARTSTRVTAIRAEDAAAGGGCALTVEDAAGSRTERYDQVYFTAPTKLARPLVSPSLLPLVERAERDFPTASAYLGVACLVLAARRPLTPFYVLNIGDERIELTGLIEMTNLIDRESQTAGLSLLYLPKYLDSADPRLDQPDGVLAGSLMERGLLRLFPDLRPSDFAYQGVHRARFVQPLPLVRPGDDGRAGDGPAAIGFDRPFQILNTSMLTCATLNNNEVVGLVDRFVDENRARLGLEPPSR